MRAAAFLALGALLATTTARGALTPSEDIVLRQLVTGSQTANASHVRALVARPDLSADESATAMTQALTPTAITDSRVAFLHMVLFGPGSEASRGVLAAATTKALIARADSIFDKSPSFDAPSDASGELLRIYAFLGSDVANAGTPQPGRAHDPQAGIDASTYETCAKALADHLKHHSATLQPATALPAIGARIRAQAMLATFDMGADSPTRIIDGADRIGLDATRRPMLLERNILLLDNGRGAPAIAAVTSVVHRFRSSALGDVEAVYFGDDHGFRAHGAVIAIKDNLDTTRHAEGYPADEVAESPASSALSDLALTLSASLSKRVLGSRGDLRLAVDRDTQNAGNDGKKLLGPLADTTPESVAAGALRMLLVDAPRTLDLAMSRFLASRPESVAFVSDAIGLLAASAGPDGVQSLVLGKANPDGTTTPLSLSAVRLNPNGTAAAFTVDGAHWEIVRGDTGAVTGVKHDGQPLSFSMLAHARIPVSGGTGWSGGGLSVTPMYGSPLVGVVSGPRIRLVGQGELDVAGVQAPGDDAAFDADVKPEGAFEVLLRAKAGHDGLGIGLKVSSGSPTTVSLVSVGPTGAEHELAQNNTLGSVDHVHVEVRGTTLRAACTHRGHPPVTLEAPVPAHQAHGDIALVIKKGASVELDQVAVRH